MALYNATGSGLVGPGSNVLIQVYGSGVLGRLRIHSWDLSFQGIVAGNLMRVTLAQAATLGTASQYVDPAVIDGESKFASVKPLAAVEFAPAPTLGDVLDDLTVVDSGFMRKQYAKGREPVVGTSEGLVVACEPSDLFTPVPYKVNVTFSL